MSVIAGIWSFEGTVPVAASCHQMLQALSIYGSDRSAQYSSTSIALGVRLLPLLPEDTFDRQPLSGQGVTCLVTDIRLDNRAELASALDLSEATLADSALLLAAWQRWGEQCVTHLTGAFSFAIWNEQEQHLFLARDHTGDRSLFYASTDRWFAFASMPKGLHGLPFLPAEIEEEYVARYLVRGYSPSEQTIFRNVRRLPPGCVLSVRREKTRLWRHWQTDHLKELRLGSPEAYLDCFRERFDRGVRARLRTTGKVGAELSGGLDSGSVVATAAQLLAGAGRELTCFTAIPRAGFSLVTKTHFADESSAAAEVAALYANVNHVLVDSSDTSFLDILDKMNGLYDHPCFAPSNEVWANAIFDRARASGITVLLHGQCGNSTISYEGMDALSAWFRSGAWATLARVGWQLMRAGHSSMRGIVRRAVWPSLPFWLRSRTDPQMRGFSLDDGILRREIAQRLDLERAVCEDFHRVSPDGRTMLHTLVDFGESAETAMAAQGGWQMDFRDPTYDRHVAEFCLTVPLEEFLRDGRQRSLVRRAMVGRLPESTLRRTQRGWQSADWRLNLAAVRGRMMAEVQQLKSSPLASRMLDLTRMQSLIEDFSNGFEQIDAIGPHHTGLTRGFSVGRFLLQYDQR